jgi:hypothetical protein
MSTVNIFEQASRLDLRFETHKGSLSVSDLWQLPLTSKSGLSLDAIAIGLNAALKEVGEVKSFVDDKPVAGTAELQLRFDIVKHIIDVRKVENTAKLESAERAEKKRKLQALLAQKQDEALGNLSMEDIQKQINDL